MNNESSERTNSPLRILLISGVVLLVILILFTIGAIAIGRQELADKIIPGIFSILAVTIPLIIKEYLDAEKERKKQKEAYNITNEEEETSIPKSSENTFDVFMFGHSGTGKTTFIQRLFTFDTTPLKSTKEFDYYSVEVPMRLEDLNENRTIEVKIADYKGQDVTQLFEAARQNTYINSLIFFADVAPSYKDGKKLDLEEVVALMTDDFEKELMERVNTHRYKYLSEFLMQAVFTYASSKYLKSVRLVINKFDILEVLQEQGVIDKGIDLEVYAQHLFEEPIKHLEAFCRANEIEDFKTVVASATKSYQTRETFTEILKKFIY